MFGPAQLLALVLLGLCGIVTGDVALLYVVHRHGARNFLQKSSLLQESSSVGGPTLLPEGQRQLYNAGQGLRQRYLNASSCGDTCMSNVAAGSNYGVVGTPGVGFHAYNTLARSSALARTIASGRSLHEGLFPPNASMGADPKRYLPDGEQVLPTYMVDEKEDILIRSYSKCPAYDQLLSNWYKGAEFKAKEAESEALRLAVKAKMPSLNCNLTNWWNVYDAWNVYRSFGVGEPMPVIDDSMFDQITKLANWLEVSKMRSNFTGQRLGGPLLQDLRGALVSAAQALGQPGAQQYVKLLTVSAHYNTMLGLLTAMGLDTNEDVLGSFDALTSAAPVYGGGSNWLATGMARADSKAKIPGPGSLIAFELHQPAGITPGTPIASNQLAVRLVVQDGPGAPFTTIPLPCTPTDANSLAMLQSIVGDTEACWLNSTGAQNFLSVFLPEIGDVTQTWCNNCNNTDVSACGLSSQAGLISQQDAKIKQLTAALAAAGGADLAPTPSLTLPLASTDLAGTCNCTDTNCTTIWDSFTTGHEGWEIAVAVVVSIVGTAALSIMLVMCCMRGRDKPRSGSSGWQRYSDAERDHASPATLA